MAQEWQDQASWCLGLRKEGCSFIRPSKKSEMTALFLKNQNLNHVNWTHIFRSNYTSFGHPSFHHGKQWNARPVPWLKRLSQTRNRKVENNSKQIKRSTWLKDRECASKSIGLLIFGYTTCFMPGGPKLPGKFKKNENWKRFIYKVVRWRHT